MRRQLIVVGLMAFAVLLFVSISATVAAPGNIPLLQIPEQEPNNSPDEANPISVDTQITGEITQTGDVIDTDYFSFTTTSGMEYVADLTVLTSSAMKLQVQVRDQGGLLGTSSASNSFVQLSWSSQGGINYIQVRKQDVPSMTLTTSYQLQVSNWSPTSTPTNTPIPTDTPIPTQTPIPGTTPSAADGYEPNNSVNETYVLPVVTSVTLYGLNFYPPGDEDWFRLWAKSGKWYQVTTSDLSGVDTYVEVHDQNNSAVESDDDGGGGYASQVTWSASYDGYYYIRVTNKAGSGTYNLKVEEASTPTSDPTSTPGPAPTNPDADRCDKTELGNHDFDHACVISANVSEGFNFNPPPYGGPDNDFFKVWVKPGLLFECATSNLSASVDPNMIVYDHNRDPIGGNDDVEPGDYNSYFAYYATYEGWLYLLVGTGDRTPSNVSDSNYTLRCDAHVPGQPTATSTPESTGTPGPTATPGPQAATPTPSGSPIATSTPSEGLTVRPLTTPTPVPATTPAPRFIPISLLVYFDANDDRQPGAGEGIAGISTQAYEMATNQLLAQGFTDEQGSLEFTVASSGPVRVNVPFFGFSQLVAGEGASIYLRVPPQPLPGGAP